MYCDPWNLLQCVFYCEVPVQQRVWLQQSRDNASWRGALMFRNDRVSTSVFHRTLKSWCRRTGLTGRASCSTSLRSTSTSRLDRQEERTMKIEGTAALCARSEPSSAPFLRLQPDTPHIARDASVLSRLTLSCSGCSLTSKHDTPVNAEAQIHLG